MLRKRAEADHKKSVMVETRRLFYGFVKHGGRGKGGVRPELKNKPGAHFGHTSCYRSIK